MLYEARKAWTKPPFEYGEDFYEFMSERMGKGAETLRRMVEIWTWVIEKPKHSKARLNKIFQLPPSGLWYVKQAAKEGQLTEENWKQIETAPNKAELREIMLSVRGPYRRGKGALRIMEEEDGSLVAGMPDQPYRPIGRLNVYLEEEDDIVAAANERIRNAAGIFRR